MPLYMRISWMYFCIAVGLGLLINIMMSFSNKKFFLMHVVIRKFSILDLEFPASAQELAFIIEDIYKLPVDLSKKTLKAVRTQLYLDFIFMPAIYGSIFILCMNVSMKMVYVGHKLFAALAWLQLVSWICDIIENIYLLNKIRRRPVVSKPGVQKAYDVLEVVKWGIPLVGLVCSFAALFYYWIAGKYAYHSLFFISIVLVEVLLFSVVRKFTAKSEKQQLEEFQQIVN